MATDIHCDFPRALCMSTYDVDCFALTMHGNTPTLLFRVDCPIIHSSTQTLIKKQTKTNSRWLSVATRKRWCLALTIRGNTPDVDFPRWLFVATPQNVDFPRWLSVATRRHLFSTLTFHGNTQTLIFHVDSPAARRHWFSTLTLHGNTQTLIFHVDYPWQHRHWFFTLTIPGNTDIDFSRWLSLATQTLILHVDYPWQQAGVHCSRWLSVATGTTTVVCEHGGTCQNLNGSFQCNCMRGFTGRRCEKNINECDSDPCQNDGTCLDERGAYRCICMPGESTITYMCRFQMTSWQWRG